MIRAVSHNGILGRAAKLVRRVGSHNGVLGRETDTGEPGGVAQWDTRTGD